MLASFFDMISQPFVITPVITVLGQGCAGVAADKCEGLEGGQDSFVGCQSRSLPAQPQSSARYLRRMAMPLLLMPTAAMAEGYDHTIDQACHMPVSMSALMPQAKADVSLVQPIGVSSNGKTRKITLALQNVPVNNWDRAVLDQVQANTWAYCEQNNLDGKRPLKNALSHWMDLVHAALNRMGFISSQEMTERFVLAHNLVPTKGETYYLHHTASIDFEIAETFILSFLESQRIAGALYQLNTQFNQAGTNSDLSLCDASGAAFVQMENWLAESDFDRQLLMGLIPVETRLNVIAKLSGDQFLTEEDFLALSTKANQILKTTYNSSSAVGQVLNGDDVDEIDFEELDDESLNYLIQSFSVLGINVPDKQALKDALLILRNLFSYEVTENKVGQQDFITCHFMVNWVAVLGGEAFGFNQTEQNFNVEEFESLCRQTIEKADYSDLRKTLKEAMASYHDEEIFQGEEEKAKAKELTWYQNIWQEHKIGILLLVLFILDMIGPVKRKLSDVEQNSGNVDPLPEGPRRSYRRRRKSGKTPGQKRRERAQEARVSGAISDPERKVLPQQPERPRVNLVVVEPIMDVPSREERMAAYARLQKERAAQVEDEETPSTPKKLEAQVRRVSRERDQGVVLAEKMNEYLAMEPCDVVDALAKGAHPIVGIDKAEFKQLSMTTNYAAVIEGLVKLKHTRALLRGSVKLIKSTKKSKKHWSINLAQWWRIVYSRDGNKFRVCFIGNHGDYDRFINGL